MENDVKSLIEQELEQQAEVSHEQTEAASPTSQKKTVSQVGLFSHTDIKENLTQEEPERNADKQTVEPKKGK